MDHFLSASFGETSENNSSDEKLEEILRDIDFFTISGRYPLNTDVLQFWHAKRLESGWINLSNLAKIVLSVPATQVSVERCFSALKLVLSDQRTNLTKENLENILMIRLNK